MSEQSTNKATPDVSGRGESKQAAGRKSPRPGSLRGAFEFFADPVMARAAKAGEVDWDAVLDEYDYSDLSEKYGEEVAREKLTEMLESYAEGISVTVLFAQEGDNGMNLTHAWFGPNLELYRHSHPRYSDCIYYVLAGELIVGRRHLGPGAGFFLPANQPYKFSAGPDGVEILEFRADGLGESIDADTKIEEKSLEDINRIIANSMANRDRWKLPSAFGATGRE